MTEVWLHHTVLYFLLLIFYRDITISFSGKKIRAHKVILAARSKKWCAGDLADQTELELEGQWL